MLVRLSSTNITCVRRHLLQSVIFNQIMQSRCSAALQGSWGITHFEGMREACATCGMYLEPVCQMEAAAAAIACLQEVHNSVDREPDQHSAHCASSTVIACKVYMQSNNIS